MLAGRVAQGAERQQELVQKNDPGCARQGVEVERNRAQTRIALTTDIDRQEKRGVQILCFFSKSFTVAGTISPLFEATPKAPRQIFEQEPTPRRAATELIGEK